MPHLDRLTGTLALTAAAFCVIGPLAQADSIEILSATEVLGYTAGADYGPPPSVRFYEPGPLVIESGDEAGLFRGPGDEIDSFLFVVTLTEQSLLDLGAGSISLMTDIGSIDFLAGDFLTGAALGFPDQIQGIGNGKVNDIRFVDNLHAAAEISLSTINGASTEDLVGEIALLSPQSLRVDLFGVSGGSIINNTPNSGALGIIGGPGGAEVPEPGEVVLLLLGLSGIAAAARRRRARN